MKYIIMCGGEYKQWQEPKHFTKINGEHIITRTIRLLKEFDAEDINISSNSPAFERLGVPVLKHENNYTAAGNKITGGYWCEAFYPTDEPTCYIFGDVVFSPNAIQTIVDTDTKDIDFFASAPPFAANYIKKWAEPFALKVKDTEHLKHSISLCKQYADRGFFMRKPIMWELWQVIQGAPLNQIDFNSYIHINDYTCDIDERQDARQIEKYVKSAL